MTTGKKPVEEPASSVEEAGISQEAAADEQPVHDEEVQAVHPQRQMVPPTVTKKQRKGRYNSDPNWYPDPDKPLERGY